MDTTSLATVLRSAGWMPSGASVSSISEEQAGGGGGLGMASRLTITYKHDEERVLTLIAKQARRSIRQSIAMLEHEVRAYQSDIFVKAGIALPQHLVVTEGSLAPALLLQDLGDSSFKRFKTGCTEREAFAAIETAAALHAEHWKYPLERYNWVPNVIDSDVTRYCIESLDGFSSWPSSLQTHATFVASHAAMVASHLTGRHTTITHGDFHCLNLSFKDVAGIIDVTVVDLQLVQRATPMLDIARFIVTSIRGGLRGQLDRKLLDHYHGRLLQLGVADYPYEQMLNDFRLALIWNLAVPLAIYANHSPTTRLSIGDNLPLEREACDAMDDWDCLDLRF
jgi:aminoglycoside/choline kinase family phosphotransferase